MRWGLAHIAVSITAPNSCSAWRLVVRIAVTAACLGKSTADHVANRDRCDERPCFLPAEMIEHLRRDQDGGDHASHRVELGRHERALGLVDGAAHRYPSLDAVAVSDIAMCCGHWLF